MDFEICYSLSRTAPSKIRETPLASCSEDSKEVTYLGEFTMAHLWHLPFKVPESKFCQPCENGPNHVDLAHVSPSYGRLSQNQKPKRCVHVMRNRNVM